MIGCCGIDGNNVEEEEENDQHGVIREELIAGLLCSFFARLVQQITIKRKNNRSQLLFVFYLDTVCVCVYLLQV